MLLTLSLSLNAKDTEIYTLNCETTQSTSANIGSPSTASVRTTLNVCGMLQYTAAKMTLNKLTIASSPDERARTSRTSL